MAQHGVFFKDVDDGVDLRCIRCLCGWVGPTSESLNDGIDAYADHRIAAALDAEAQCHYIVTDDEGSSFCRLAEGEVRLKQALGDQVARNKTLLNRVTILGQLRVTSDGPRALVVDASTVVRSNHQPIGWRLTWEPDGQWHGQWHHGPSGESGTLGELLHGIASCYLDRSSPEHFGGAVTDAMAKPCDCGHTFGQHSSAGCEMGGCNCTCYQAEGTRADATVGEDSEHG